MRRRLSENGNGTYIGEMLAERDSALARWPDRHGEPLRVWIQPTSDVADWHDAYADGVRSAVHDWDALGLPVRFVFTQRLRTRRRPRDVHRSLRGTHQRPHPVGAR